MAGSSGRQNPPDLFSQGRPRDPGLEALMKQHSITPTLLTDHSQDPSPGPRDSHRADTQTSYTSYAFSYNDEFSGNSGPAGPSSRANPRYPPETPEANNQHGYSESSDGDTEMLDANSNFDGQSSVAQPPPPPVQGIPGHSESHHEDILASVPNLFRLLDLVDEHGSGGIVEKIVIDQNSLHRLLNIVHPGSYDSVSKINFRVLDQQLSIKPIGVYGIRQEIIKFLRQAHYIDEPCAALLSQTGGPDDSSPALRSGLYLVLDPNHQDQGSSKAAYIIYWPEDTTWDDQAASSSVRRNRVTFMRYLNKLADQTIALVSSSQAQSLVWDTSAHNKDLPEDQQENDDDARLFDFEVAKSLEQEEDAVGSPGFTASVESRLLPHATERAESRVRLVPGEQKTALLVVRNEKEQLEEKQFDSNISPMNLRKMIESKDCPIQLGNLTPADLDVLAAHGLRNQHKRIFEKYDTRLRELTAERSNMERADKKHIEDRINRDRPKIREEILHSVRIQYDKLYPSLKLGCDVSHGPEVTALLHNLYPDLNKVANEIERKQKLDAIQDREFQTLKGKWPMVKTYLEKNPKLSDAEHADFINDILNGSNAEAGVGRVHQAPSRLDRIKQSSWNPLNYVPGTSGYSASSTTNSQSSTGFTNHTNTHISDPQFVSQIRAMEQEYPSLSGIMRQVNDALGRNLDALEKRVIADQLDRITSMERQRQNAAASGTRDHGHREEIRRAFESVMRELKEAMIPNARQTRRVDWIRSTSGGHGHNSSYSSNAQYRWGGSVASLRTAQNRHSIYPLELTEQDSQVCRANEDHVPQPKVDTRHKFEFILLKGRSVEFIQLIRGKCLVVVAERGRTRIFIEDNVTIDHAVNSTHGKVSLSHESLGGPQCKFAFDQTTRLLAIVHGHKDDLKLSIYIFDEFFTNLRSRGSPISLRSWYGNKSIDLGQVCFVSGLEEICFVETSGRARIFSLITQQFRNASLQIDRPIIDAFSSPDGSCLFVVVSMDDSTSHRLLAFHWASFGNNKKGIESASLRPCDGYRVATRFEGRGRVHVVAFSGESKAITSTVLQITQKATEFAFRSDREHSRKKATETTNNSLIDCHLEVWTRFPVVPAVARNTLTAIDRQPRQLIFASSIDLQGVEDYFSRMISTFEATTRKPMAGTLTAIEVKPTNKTGRDIVNKTSEFKLGSFIVELLCLIPLHLAVTRENRFIPLKDGVWDPEYERSLLGADVAAIVDALSLG
ncbi:unnamed protein product, partial [Rhizoctonia solani]